MLSKKQYITIAILHPGINLDNYALDAKMLS